MFFESYDDALIANIVDIVAKITLLLLACSLFDVFARRASAAVRHRIWATAFVAVLLLPIISFVAPEYRLAILPADWSSPILAAQSQTKLDSDVAPSLAKLPAENVAEAYGSLSQFDKPATNATTPANSTSTELNQPQSNVVSSANTYTANQSTATWRQPATAVIVIWLAGFALAIVPLLFGIGKLLRLHRESLMISDVEPSRMFTNLRRQLGIRRHVQFLETQRSIVPMTWGILRPVVLIPSAWRHWATERRRLVVLHELAHVKRIDVIYQLIARVVCSIYWFHPLLWYALKRLRIERELACDDCVLMAGEVPSQYAQQLLSIAVECQSKVIPPAVAMTQRTGLENRVRALLDRARSHLPLTPRAAGCMLVAALTLVVLLASIRLDPIRSGTANANEAQPDANALVRESEVLKISGIVKADDGSPLAGAKVTVLRTYHSNTTWNYQHEILIDTISDAQGRYQAEVPAKSERFSNSIHFEVKMTRVFATKEGYGPDEIVVEPNQSTDLQLAKATQTIEGRLVDLEGKPIEGVKVRLMAIEKAAMPIEEWLEQAKSNPATFSEQRMTMAPPVGATNWPRIEIFPSKDQMLAVGIQSPIEVTSDASGRFTLSGVGDDRQATLQIESPGIATTRLHCVTHDMSSVNMPNMDPRFRAGKTFGPKFEYSVEPTQWIEGSVRDKQTGSPIPGVVVSLRQFGDSLMGVEDFVQSTTDAEGHYSLKGIPKAPAGSRSIRIRVVPPKDQPYFRHDREVPKSENLDPIHFDIELTESIWLEGQVTDALSKVGLPSMVAYYPHRDNPYAKKHEAWQAGLTTMGYGDMIPTDAAGRFRVPGMPGQGVLRVVSENDSLYELMPNIDGHKTMQDLRLKYYHIGMGGNAMQDVNVSQDEKSHRLDIALTPLNSKTIQVVDADGRDVTGYRMAGRLPKDRPTLTGRGAQYWDRQPINTATTQFVPGKTEEQQRPLMFINTDRQIGAVVSIESILGDPQPIQRITLLPCVTLTGKLVDGDGKPITRGYVQAGVELTEFQGMFPMTDGKYTSSTSKHPKYPVSNIRSLKEDGTFDYVVAPGKAYCLVLIGGDFNVVLFRDRELQPGQRVYLGTIDVSSDAKNWPAPKVTQIRSRTNLVGTTVAADVQATEAEEVDKPSLIFKGKVVHPDGTPASGAALHFVYYHHGRLPDNTIPPVATTDTKGEFEIRSTNKSDGVPPEHMTLVASKQGYGIASTPAVLFESTGQLTKKMEESQRRYLHAEFGNDKTLRLASDDKPLRGRILTVDGTPVANAQVRVMEIAQSRNDSLDAWEKATSESKADYYSLRKNVEGGMNGYQLPSVIRDTTTDKDGRFVLEGIGRERIATLLINGPSIETATFHARTRDGGTVRVPHQFGFKSEQISDEVYYPATFNFVALPSVPIEGRVVDKDSGKPLVGFLVSAGRQVTFSRGGKPYIATLTDSDGHYRLTGLSQSTQDELYVVPPRGSKYLPLGVRPKTEEAREAIEMDFELKPVALLRGHVKDTTTGKPVAGALQYSAMTKNPNLAEHRTFSQCHFHECRTDASGNFAIAVLPGEGVVTFSADDHPRYRRTPSKKPKLGDIFSSPAEMGMYETVPSFVVPGDKHFVKQIQVDSTATEMELAIELSSGVSLPVRIVRANGEPADNAIFKGTSERSGWYPLRAGSSSIDGYYADQGREIFAYDPDSHQAAFVQLSGPQSDEVLVTLKPAGTLRGRLVDKQGAALPDARLLCESIPEDNNGDASLRHTSDKDGNFELKGVIPGFKHTVWALVEGQGMSPVAKEIEVDPVKGLDLGDVTLNSQ